MTELLFEWPGGHDHVFDLCKKGELRLLNKEIVKGSQIKRGLCKAAFPLNGTVQFGTLQLCLLCASTTGGEGQITASAIKTE